MKSTWANSRVGSPVRHAPSNGDSPPASHTESLTPSDVTSDTERPSQSPPTSIPPDVSLSLSRWTLTLRCISKSRGSEDCDWRFETVPQAGLKKRVVSQPQGKALGGSSAINAQAFIAPSQVEINAWAEPGNEGWDWNGLLPYYKRVYTLHEPKDEETREALGVNWIDESVRGTEGPIQVSFPGVKENPLVKGWIDAFKGMNSITTGDPFSGKSLGGYSCAATVDPTTKTRSYAGNAYAGPLKDKDNVTFMYGVQAEKILLEKSGDGPVNATGVTVRRADGSTETMNASKEVILAAGAFNTPKLLELSGIGCKKLLTHHGVESIIDLSSVGENLQDHLLTGISYEVIDGIITGDSLMRQEPEALAAAQKLFSEHQAGPFPIGGVQSHAFMPTAADDKIDVDSHKSSEEKPSVSLVRSILQNPQECSGAWFFYLVQANLHSGSKKLVDGLMPGNFLSLGCAQTHPLSRGSTHISSMDATAMPNIDPKFFSNETDLEIMARHVQALDRLRNSEELSKFLKPDGKRNHPDSYKLADFEVAKQYVVDTAATAYHTCGTAAMLPRDKGGVIDETLRVYGTGNLRLVDASLFPMIPRGNIMSTVYAVAEKASDVIMSGR